MNHLIVFLAERGRGIPLTDALNSSPLVSVQRVVFILKIQSTEWKPEGAQIIYLISSKHNFLTDMEYQMRLKSSFVRPVLGAVILSACGVSFAQKAGDWIGYVGVASINPSASIGPLSSVGPAAASFGPVTAGATVSIGKTSTTTMSALYMFTDNVGAEFTIGIPPTMTVDVQLTSGPKPGAATAKALFPSAVAKYLFNSPSDAVRPYLGVGITSTSFTSASANNDPLVQKLAGTSVSLSSSYNPVMTGGAVVNINDRWSLNGSVSYVPMKSNATFVGTGTTTTGTLTINPTEYVLRVGYKF